MKNYAKRVTALIAVWFLVAVFASSLHLFVNAFNRIGVAVGLAASVPLAVFALWFAASANFRRFALSLSPSTLTAVQAFRVIGFVFVLMEARGALPAIFALPAGYGDMAIGITAAFVAWKFVTPAHRASFLFWQILGILDLVNAVSVGITAGLFNPQGPTMAPITVLPLSLIPTFFVPLFLILHVICIVQARNWTAVPHPANSAAAPLHQAV